MSLLLENAQFLNEKSTFFQRLANMNKNDKFSNMWLSGSNKAKFAMLDHDQSKITSKSKPSDKDMNRKFISEKMENELQKIVNALSSKISAVVENDINRLPKEYNKAVTDQTKVLRKIEVYPTIHGNSSISKSNPAIALSFVYWFDGNEFASNNGIDDDSAEEYINKNKSKIMSKLEKIDNDVIKLFSSSNIPLHHDIVEDYLSWGSFIYTTVDEAKKVLDTEEK